MRTAQLFTGVLVFLVTTVSLHAFTRHMPYDYWRHYRHHHRHHHDDYCHEEYREYRRHRSTVVTPAKAAIPLKAAADTIIQIQ